MIKFFTLVKSFAYFPPFFANNTPLRKENSVREMQSSGNQSYKLHFAMVCASNMNRSMEAHSLLNKRGLKVSSFGTNNTVKLPGPSIDRPNIYRFNTPYEQIYEELKSKDERLYTENGVLEMLHRNMSLKEAPERWQERNKTEEKHPDIVITFESRVFDAVIEDLSTHDPSLHIPVFVINLPTKDNHVEAIVGAQQALEMCNSLNELYIEENKGIQWRDAVEHTLIEFERRKNKPIKMSKMCKQTSNSAITREQVAQHGTADDAWIIFENKVYDVTNWANRHPGGRVILYYKGEDATEVIEGFHPDMEKTKKYMAPLLIGDLVSSQHTTKKVKDVTARQEDESVNAPDLDPSIKSLRELRLELEQEGRFKPNYWFYILHFLSLIMFEAISYAIIYNYGFYAIPIAAIFLGISQCQAGWLQHDFGHCSVFKSASLNQLVHYIVIGGFKGASSHWWKTRHNKHHAKTNIIYKDPDMHIEPLFSFSEKIVSLRYNRLLKIIPYQHIYWFFFGPPVVTNFLFLHQNCYFMAERGIFVDIFWVNLFYTRFDFLYQPLLGWKGCVALWMVMRFYETHWFTWVTSMNHLPMPIVEDKNENWINLQLKATQNIEPGYFNNWFTGHLNFQIEHHLFPKMPRHQYPYIYERVKKLCEENGVVYRVVPLWHSFTMIVDKLKEVGGYYIAEQQRRKAK